MALNCYNYVGAKIMKENSFEKLVGQRIAHFRKQMSLTQFELAEKLDYSDKTISKWELGQSLPNIFILNELAKFFGISLDILIGNEPIPKNGAKKKNRFKYSIIYSLLVFAVFIIAFAVLHIAFPNLEVIRPWYLILWGVAASSIPMFVYSIVYHQEIPAYISSTTFIWMVITSIYFGIKDISIGHPYVLFVAAAPFNLLTFFSLFYLFRKKVPFIKKKKIEDNEIDNEY